ncbi:hypothetical protein C8R44DRAFT_760252 [Mycena epipterygia]|nr:hypothetical protein C8R44DRAFT_760252 [Mycena epipterygia]
MLEPSSPHARLPPNNAPPNDASPPNTAQAQGSATSLDALEPRKASAGSAPLRRRFAERDASELELDIEQNASMGSTTPSSLRRCFAERDASALGESGAFSSHDSSGPTDTGDPDFDYDVFLHFCENPVNPELDEAIGAEGLLERVCGGLKGDIVRADVSTAALLPLYLEGRDPLRGDYPARDLDALHPRYFLRSAARRNQDQGHFAPNGAKSTAAPLLSAGPSSSKQGRKRPLPQDASTPAAERLKVYIDEEGDIRCPNGYWSYRKREPPAKGTVKVEQPAKEKVKRQRRGKGSRTTRGKVSTPHRIQCLLAKSEFLGAGSFSLADNGSFATTGWEGVPPPERAREEIQELYASQPRARALYPWLRYFFPAEYKAKPNVRDERATFFVDRDGLIFLYRSYRASWLMTPQARAEFEHAHNLLVGKSTESSSLQQKCRSAQRGEHLPIILGHYRQSSKHPTFAGYHTEHMKVATEFINLPIIQRIIKFISDLVELVFPGVAARFKADAAWHKAKYDIEPLFGLFWNFCLNARFRGQRRIHCKPHADARNVIGICALLIYVLSDGDNFNDTQRTWLVLWEAAVAIQLPAWTAALYPSAILFHFNVDVDEIEFVTVDGTARPTRENSRPIVEGDECGRGSLVFFNESTMRHGPATGFNTLKEAKLKGFSGVIDPKLSMQEAFERYVTFVPITPDLVR